MTCLFFIDEVAIILQAQQDTIQLIQIACEKNLSLVTFYVCRSICYSVLTLLQILNTPYASQQELIRDQIERARHALGCTVRVQGHVNQSLSRILLGVASLERNKKDDTKSNAPIRARVTASIVYESVRAYAHHMQEVINVPPVLLDLDGFNWDEPDLSFNV